MASTLSREAYQELEEIVGPEYISEEPAILDSYSFVWGNELLHDGSKFSPRPSAVVLPGSTEEVQAIVKACNRYKIKLKPHSTGFVTTALAGPEEGYYIPLDMRRMNRIIEINEKNKYAVVEPYVTFGALTIESIKRGVRPYVVGAGPSCSILANSTSYAGMGPTGMSAGFGGRNVLGVEWVLPNGDILRLGTLGSGAGWFYGDGPGPSLKGIMRGYVGHSGAMGVVTKAAIRLNPWYGPPEIGSTGNPPKYVSKMPANFKVYTITYPSREKIYESMSLIYQEDIVYSLNRRGASTMCFGMTGSNKEFYKLWQTGRLQKQFAFALGVIIDASSPREMEFRDKCLRKIIEKTGGEIFPEEEHGQSARFVHSFIGLGSVKGAFRPTGTFMSAPNAEESLDALIEGHQIGIELKQRYADKGVILDDGDSAWVSVCDQGGHMEVVWRYDPADPEAVKGVIELMKESDRVLFESKIDEATYLYNEEHFEMAGPECLHYDAWLRKIKKAFDPNLIGESSAYAMPKDES